MDNNIYLDPMAKLMKLMRKTLGNNFKSFYEGDPMYIPDTNFPACILEQLGSRVSLGATGQDKIQTEIRISLVLDKMSDVGKNDDTDMTEQQLRRYIEARDSATGDYLAGTVLRVLRTHLTLGGSAVDQRVEVRYDLQPRANQQITSEGRVTVVITENVLRSAEEPTI